MNKLKSLLFLLLCISVCFVGCDKNDDPINNDDDNTDVNFNINATIRYEASVSDVINYKIRVAYLDENGSPLKADTVESPWQYKMENIKVGALLYISCMPVPRNDLITPDKVVSSKLFIDNKLHEEDTGEYAAIVGYVLGTP